MDKQDFMELKSKISTYDYERTIHELFEIKGIIIDYENDIKANKLILKELKTGKEDEHIRRIRDLKIEKDKLKTTYIALKRNDELTWLQRRQRRAEVKEELINVKKSLKIAKKFNNTKDELLYLEYLKNNDLTNSKDILNKQKTFTKEKEVLDLKEKIKDLLLKLKTYKKDNKKLILLLQRQKLITARYNRLSEEKKEIKLINNKISNLNSKIDLSEEEKQELNALISRKTDLKKDYKDKSGKLLKYQVNSFSYWLMLLVTLLEIIYVIIFLNMMYTSYLEFPTLLVNLAFTLFLFLSAMKVKTYSKTWTMINFGFGVYLIIRMIFIIPWIAVDREAVIDEASGEIITAAQDYSSLRMYLYVFTILMILCILLANIRSSYRIRQRNLYLN